VPKFQAKSDRHVDDSLAGARLREPGFGAPTRFTHAPRVQAALETALALLLPITLAIALLGWTRARATTPPPQQTSTRHALIGHNVSPTSYTLRQGTASLGSYAAAYGITDSWMIATSPWMIVNYNMPVISTRLALLGDTLLQRFALELSYFKTFQYGFNMYKQESLFARAVATHRASSRYSVHFNLGFQHFYDDTSPYSLRPTWSFRDPTTLSTGALHEVSWNDRWGLFVETAVLGLNFPTGYAHLGVSVFTRASWGFVQLGISRSMPLGDSGWYLLRQADGSQDWAFMRPASFHPEIQVQFALD
jgi:hypothetical protein